MSIPHFGRQSMRTAIHFLALMFATVSLPGNAQASVAVCKPLHSGEPAEDKSEAIAKARALESWTSGARLSGEAFTRWGIAWNRRLECNRTDAGTYRCQASGHPCSIRHVPPDEFVRFKRD